MSDDYSIYDLPEDGSYYDDDDDDYDDYDDYYQTWGWRYRVRNFLYRVKWFLNGKLKKCPTCGKRWNDCDCLPF